MIAPRHGRVCAGLINLQNQYCKSFETALTWLAHMNLSVAKAKIRGSRESPSLK